MTRYTFNVYVGKSTILHKEVIEITGFKISNETFDKALDAVHDNMKKLYPAGTNLAVTLVGTTYFFQIK